MSSTPPYVVRFTITPTAALDAARLFSARFFSRYVAVLIVVLFVGLAIAAFGNPQVGVWLSLVSLFLLATTRLPPLERWMIGLQMRSLIGGESELVIGEEGLHYRNPIASGDIGWSALTEVRENEKTVVFMRDRLLASYAPSSAFLSPAQRAEAVAFARAKIAAARSSVAQGTT
jgi:hypothetical protein